MLAEAQRRSLAVADTTVAGMTVADLAWRSHAQRRSLAVADTTVAGMTG